MSESSKHMEDVPFDAVGFRCVGIPTILLVVGLMTAAFAGGFDDRVVWTPAPPTVFNAQ